MDNWIPMNEILNNAFLRDTVIGKACLWDFVFRCLGLTALQMGVLKEKKSNVPYNTQMPEYQDDDEVGFISYNSFWWIKVSLLLASILIYRLRMKILDKEQPIRDGDLGEDRTLVQIDQNNVRITRNLRRLYVFYVIFKILLEGVFIALHYYLYGFQLKRPCVYEQSSSPHGVNCYYVKASQECGMMIINLVFDCFSLLLGMLDICLLGWEKVKQKMTNRSSPHSPEFIMEPQNLSV